MQMGLLLVTWLLQLLMRATQEAAAQMAALMTRRHPVLLDITALLALRMMRGQSCALRDFIAPTLHQKQPAQLNPIFCVLRAQQLLLPAHLTLRAAVTRLWCPPHTILVPTLTFPPVMK